MIGVDAHVHVLTRDGLPKTIIQRNSSCFFDAAGTRHDHGNTCHYTYGPTGDRLTATYYSGTNASGTTLAQWGYYDYLSVGSPSKGAHAFQTLCKLDGAGNRTPEEFHYSFDQQGRLFEATFAQTPSNTTPDSNGYYDGYESQTRARAHYEYDAGGRLYWIGHYWDSLISGSSNYSSQAILGQSCDYEYSGLNRGFKTDSIYKLPTVVGQANWTSTQTDSYSYDPSLDYLTGANYGDRITNPPASPTWSYDAAGNRNDAVTDNLNRATSLGGTAVTSDILGNRLTMGTNSYSWDMLNRMTSFTSASGATSYVYRTDGMRVTKSNSNGSTSYRYDGQMGTEDTDYAANGSVSKVTDYGIGARGIDVMYVTQSGTTTAAYPIYDAHGNMISTLSKQGTGGFAYSAVRTYDAWGAVRRGAATGDPKGRYCANLGHKQDDESGLVYMRARFYEPTSGRFIKEDPARQSQNWFAYCSSNPMMHTDQSGKVEDINCYAIGMLIGTIAFIAAIVCAAGPPGEATLVATAAALAISAAGWALAYGATKFGASSTGGYLLVGVTIMNILLAVAAGLIFGEKVGGYGGAAVILGAAYDVELIGLLMCIGTGD